jgi:very-short-patch-repair endonuclease
MEERRHTDLARDLRQSSTDAEKFLWSRLRRRQLAGRKFRRQFPMFGYIVDFVCMEARLVVELDGSQHAETVAYDETRTRTLVLNGFSVLRFWNNDVLNDSEGVLTTMLRHFQAPPSPQPSPASGRGG